MIRKNLLGILVALLLMLAATCLWLSTRFVVLTVNRTARVEVSGAPVAADVLDSGQIALVTLREPKTQHSYLLLFETDTDSTGDAGSVVDCEEWTAPRLPLLLVSKRHPDCRAAAKANTSRSSLIRKNRSLEFVTGDQRTVRIADLNK
jgi:hypothetical protein